MTQGSFPIVIYSPNNYLLVLLLQYNRYQITWIDKRAELYETLENQACNLVIIDENITDETLLSLCKTFNTAFLVIGTTKITNSNLEKSAYLTKPLHIPSLLNHIAKIENQCLSNAYWELNQTFLFNYHNRIILNKHDHQQFFLTSKEANIIKHLYEHPKHAINKHELLKIVWNQSDDLTHQTLETHTVENHIYRLRQKLGSDTLITTDHHGYKLKRP